MLMKVWKFPTGSAVPEGAVFLSTETETIETIESSIRDDGTSVSRKVVQNLLVWHYFLVDSRIKPGQLVRD